MKDKLSKESVQDLAWLAKAEFRNDNRAWLDISFTIGLTVLRALREKGMS